jgi:Flp pilus assembly protein TadD
MKKVLGIIAVLAIMLFSTSNSCGNEKQDLCLKSIGPLAASVMTARQKGIDISRLFSSFENENYDPSIKQLLKSIVMDAYSTPKYSSPAYQQNAITEFQNRVTLECLKSYAK